MNQPAFDTLEYVRILEEHGFSAQQTDGLVQAQTQVIGTMENNLTTKHDLRVVKADLEATITAVGARITAVEAKLLHAIETSKYENLRNAIIIFGMNLTALAITAGIIIAILT